MSCRPSSPRILVSFELRDDLQRLAGLSCVVVGISFDLGYLCTVRSLQGHHEDLEAPGHGDALGEGFRERSQRRRSMQFRGPLVLGLGSSAGVDGVEYLEWYLDASRGSDSISDECPTNKISFWDVGDQRAVITCVQHGPSTKRASIQTRRVEIDSGDHDEHCFQQSSQPDPASQIQPEPRPWPRSRPWPLSRPWPQSRPALQPSRHPTTNLCVRL